VLPLMVSWTGLHLVLIGCLPMSVSVMLNLLMFISHGQQKQSRPSATTLMA
jgi:hypothetical protein